MDISVIIVSWNARNYLEECLNSLSEFACSRSVEIIVVDNASTDGSPEMVEAQFPQVKLIRNGKNLGFATANNVGIRKSTGRYVALINSDVRVLNNCLDPLADYLDEHPNVGNVGPRILNRDMTLQSSCRKFPSLWNNFCDATTAYRAFKKSRFLSGEHMFFFPHDRIMAVDALVGCFWMVRRSALETVGLLDEEFFMYSEDVDWCRRCWNAGWCIIFLPTVSVIHYRGGSSASDPSRFAVEQQRAVLQYWAKHHSRIAYLTIAAILFVRHSVRYIVAAASNFTKPSPIGKDLSRLQVSAACIEALVARSRAEKI